MTGSDRSESPNEAARLSFDATSSSAPPAGLEAGPPGIPRRVLWIAIAAFAVLGIGGALADHSFNVPSTAATPAAVPHSAAVSQSLASFVGLRQLGSHEAPALALRTAAGRLFSWSSLSGHPALLSFQGGACGGVCQVVVAELRLARRQLERAGIAPAILIVNSDPRLALAPSAGGTATTGHRSSSSSPRTIRLPVSKDLPGAVVLDGTLAQLQRAWRSYGVTIELDPTSGALAYTQVIDLVDQHGRLRSSLTPFANQSFTGQASLPAADLDRFAGGITRYLEATTR